MEKANGMLKVALVGAVLCAAAMPASVRAFEKIGLIDSLDGAPMWDPEAKWGTIKRIDDCMRPGSNVILWRDKGGGGWMRYLSQEEPAPYASEYGIDKRRNLPKFGCHWDLRLDTCFDVFDFVFKTCRERKIGYGIHQTYEENHTSNSSLSLWNLKHPEYWNCSKGGVPFPGTVSLAYPEVLAHKLRFADEHIALKPQRIFLDVWRSGNYRLEYEYVKPNIDKWNKLYPGEDLPKPFDPRWTKICSEPIMAYLREYGRRCKAAGIEFVLGLPTSAQNGQGPKREEFPGQEEDLVNIHCWRAYGIDWKQLAKEGAVDGIWLMDVRHDPKDPFGSLAKTLKYTMANRGQAKIYFGVDWYNYRQEGIFTYAKQAGCSDAEAAKRMLNIAREAGCAGIVYEVIDPHCYPKDVSDALREGTDEYVADGECPAISPDGRKLAFQVVEGTHMHLGVKDLETGKTAWIVRGATEATKNENACHPAWSKDGALVYSYANLTNTAYQRFSAKGSKEGFGYALRLLKEGKTTELIGGLSRNFSASFSPKGDEVYFVRQNGRSRADDSRICKLALSKPGVTQDVHFSPAGDSGVSQPVVSPDGRSLIWSEISDNGVNWRLRTANLSRMNATKPLTDGRMAAYAPNWHPNGRWIVFTGFREGDPGWCVYLKDVSSGNERCLVRGTDPCVSADGKYVYYSQDGKIYRFELAHADVIQMKPVAGKVDLRKDAEKVTFKVSVVKPGEAIAVPDDGQAPDATRFMRFTFDMIEKPAERQGVVNICWDGKALMHFFLMSGTASFISREQCDSGRQVNNGQPLAKGPHRITCVRGKDATISVQVDDDPVMTIPCGLGLMPIAGEGVLKSLGEAFNVRDFEYGYGWPKNVKQ